MKLAFKIVLIFMFVLPLAVKGQVLKINEIMPKNGVTSFDSFGNSSDWIEIYNNTNNAIQLSDYYISNDLTDKLMWQLPTKNLQPHEIVLIYCSNENVYAPDYHTNFKLKNAPDTLGIFYKDGSTIELFSYKEMRADVSYGCKPDGSSSLVYFNGATPNATNNNSIGYNCILDTPTVSVLSGFYPSPLSVNVSHSVAGVQLRYSTNGDAPNILDPVYTNALNLVSDYSPNRISAIPTNPGTNAPLGSYTVLRSNNRGWLPPDGDVQNINVFKVKAFKSGCISSEVVTRTYLLDDGNIVFPDMPIISLQVDSIDFFSNDTGIYVYGNRPDGNYNEQGAAWERSSYFEYFDENKNVLINQKLGVELHGNGSRHSLHKNIRISAKSMYGLQTIEAPLFKDSDVTTFKHLIVRSPGHRPDCNPRDELATSIVAKLGFDIQNYSISTMYLNGEYWGTNVVKERFNEDFISIKYDMGLSNIVMLESDGDLEYGVESDTAHYNNMILFVEQNSLDIPSNMAYLNTQMDIDNYINFIGSEVYIGNGDWPNNNMRFWRKRVDFNDYASLGHDGRWRWMFFDLDGGFGGTCDDVYYAIDNLERALSDSLPYAKYTRLFRGLCSYQSFREMYINQTCDRLNSTFLSSVTEPKLVEIENQLAPVMMEHVNRWGYPSVSTTLVDRMTETPSLTKWNYLLSRFHLFTDRRSRLVYRHMQEQWSLGDSIHITMDVNDPNMGYVQINTLNLTDELEGVNPVVYPWIGKYFENIEIPINAHPYPGYRFKEWLGTTITKADTSINISTDSTFTAIFEIDPDYVTPLPITINEVQAWNSSTVADDYFELEDWIELYNPNDVDVDIKNYYLTDDATNLKKYWIGPNSTIIKAKGWMIFWADDDNGQGQHHTNFKLSKDGELVALVSPDGVTVVDSIRFGPQIEDFSYGRQSDGLSPWINFGQPTPFYSNLATNVADISQSIKLVVYPNPANMNNIHFNAIISGELYNISGVNVLSFDRTNTINISHLTKGVYFVKNSLTSETVKLVIN
jgi:hypothetical protein